MLHLLRWSRRQFPRGNSLISQQILLLVAGNAGRDCLSIKQVLSEFEDNRERAAQLIRELATDGWINVVQCPEDNRVKLVCASDKCCELIQKYMDSYRRVFPAMKEFTAADF